MQKSPLPDARDYFAQKRARAERSYQIAAACLTMAIVVVALLILGLK